MINNKDINTDLIFDIVKSISTSKIYSQASPFYKKKIWILNCSESKVKVLPDILENSKMKAFFKDIENGKVINKRYRFSIAKLSRCLIDVEEIAEV